MCINSGRNQNFEFLDEKVTYVFRLFDFWIFFCLSFFSFSFLFAAVIDLLVGLLAVKKLLRKCHPDRQFLPWAARCSDRKFWSEFFAQLFEHFCAYLRLHSADHFDHCKDLFLLQKMNIDDANFGQKWWRQKWKKGQGSSQPVTGSTGVSGLNKNKLRSSQKIKKQNKKKHNKTRKEKENDCKYYERRLVT